MNKKTLRLLPLLVLVITLFTQCSKEDEFDEALLEGMWYNQTEALYFTFNGDHNGQTATDTNGSNAKQYTWSLDGDELSVSYKSASGFLDGLTEVYILKKLTSSRMEAYQMDEPDVTVIFDKQ